MKKILILLFVLVAVHGYPINLNNLVHKGPVITINRDSRGVFKTVTVIAHIDAPYELIWKTIKDINAYKTYMPRVVESKIVSENKSETTAFFEIEVPFQNTSYTLHKKFDKKKKTIDVRQVSGDLEGSHWNWKFYPSHDKTIVVYSGIMKNYSAILEKFDDENLTITIGVNISSLLATIKSIKERSEKEYKKQETKK